MFNNYPIYSEQDEMDHKIKIQQFYKIYSFDIRGNLASTIK